MNAGLNTHAEPGWASLLTGLVDQGKELVLQEAALAKLEIRYELTKARSAAISIGIAVGIMAIGAMLLALMLVYGLAAQSGIPLWGCYGIVGAVMTVIGAGSLVSAKSKAMKPDSVKDSTATGVGTDARQSRLRENPQ